MKKGFKSAWSSLKNSKTGMFGLILVLLIIICAIFAPLLAPYDPLAQDVMIKLKDPIWGADPVAGHLLGTDQLGRDILSRLLYGARVTLIVALAGTVVGGIVGVVLGSLAGYYGKWVDAVIMRIMDMMLAIPSILLAYELFGGVGLELIALGCGVCYMLSGTHGLYSSQLFVTEKLLSEYTESWGKRLHH